MIFGALVKGVTAYLLPAVKIGGAYLGIYASPISTMLFYLTITVINFYFLSVKTDVRISALSVFIRPLLAAILCGITAVGSYTALSALFGEMKLFTLIAIGLAAIIYLISLLVFGAITRSDVELVPKADKLVNRLPVVRKLIRDK